MGQKVSAGEKTISEKKAGPLVKKKGTTYKRRNDTVRSDLGGEVEGNSCRY